MSLLYLSLKLSRLSMSVTNFDKLFSKMYLLLASSCTIVILDSI